MHGKVKPRDRLPHFGQCAPAESHSEALGPDIAKLGPMASPHVTFKTSKYELAALRRNTENEDIFVDRNSVEGFNRIRFENVGSGLSYLDKRPVQKNENANFEMNFLTHTNSITEMKPLDAEMNIKNNILFQQNTEEFRVNELAHNEWQEKGPQEAGTSLQNRLHSVESGLERSTANYDGPISRVADAQFFGNNSKPEPLFPARHDLRLLESRNQDLEEKFTEMSQCSNLKMSGRLETTLDKSNFESELIRGRLPSQVIPRYDATEGPREITSKEYPQYIITDELSNPVHLNQSEAGKTQAESTFTFGNKNGEFQQSLSNSIFQGKNPENFFNQSAVVSKEAIQSESSRQKKFQPSKATSIGGGQRPPHPSPLPKKKRGLTVAGRLRQNIGKLDDFKGLKKNGLHKQPACSGSFLKTRSDEKIWNFPKKKPFANTFSGELGNLKNNIKTTVQSTFNNQKNIFRDRLDLKSETKLSEKRKPIPQFMNSSVGDPLSRQHFLGKREFPNMGGRNISRGSPVDSSNSSLRGFLPNQNKFQRVQLDFEDGSATVKIRPDCLSLSTNLHSSSGPENIEFTVTSKLIQKGLKQMQRKTRELQELFSCAKVASDLTAPPGPNQLGPFFKKRGTLDSVIKFVRGLSQDKFEIKEKLHSGSGLFWNRIEPKMTSQRCLENTDQARTFFRRIRSDQYAIPKSNPNLPASFSLGKGPYFKKVRPNFSPKIQPVASVEADKNNGRPSSFFSGESQNRAPNYFGQRSKPEVQRVSPKVEVKSQISQKSQSKSNDQIPQTPKRDTALSGVAELNFENEKKKANKMNKYFDHFK